MIRALALVYRRCVESSPNPIPLLLAWLHHTQAFAHVREYAWAIRALVLSTSIDSFDEITRVFHLLHSLVKGLCSCQGMCLNNTCISFKHICSFILWDHMSLLFFPSTCWGWFPHFCWWFLSWNICYFRLEGIYFCFDSFTMSLFLWPFRYGVWTFTRLFCPKWFYKWFWHLFQGMWAHCLRSCSAFNVVFILCVLTLNVGKIV
jgi:hypothetical protein